MNMKQTALILCFFIGCGILLFGQSTGTDARLVPFTWEIVNDIQNSRGNLGSLKYYLSKPFSIVPEQNNASRKIEINEGMVTVTREQNISIGKIEFTTADAGALRTIGTASESFVIVFKDIPLRFTKNLQGRYDLFSAEIDSKIYNLRPIRRSEDGHPQLCILYKDSYAELNDRLEMQAVPDSEPGGSRRSTNVQQPAYRDTGGRSYQMINIGGSANQFGPSRYIDGQSYVNRKGIIEYVRRQGSSVDNGTLNRLIEKYFEEAGIEGVNLDIAIAQMLYATNFLSNHRMTSHNYAGLSTNGVRWDGSFINMTTGVRAHIQHLKGYVSTRPPRTQIVDPRYQILVDLGYLGNIRTFDRLFTAWTASSASYARSINEILNGLYLFSGNY